MLNELDSGVVLLRDGAHVVHMNHAARRGLRRLVTLGTEGARVAVVLIPIGDPIDGSAPLTALVFGRSRLCERISVQWFARAHGLTPAESTVLELLSDGLQPSDIARANAVGMTSVRTQIKGVRDKSCAASIRGPLHQVAMLPAINARPLRPCAGRVPGCGPPARACNTSHCAWACNTCGVGFTRARTASGRKDRAARH